VREVAELLGVPVATLYQWRTQGIAPRGYRVGKHVRFAEGDVLDWLEQHADEPRPAA
jgi:excisionase family DNA binding protein